jgi:hypothetical protein
VANSNAAERIGKVLGNVKDSPIRHARALLDDRECSGLVERQLQTPNQRR